MPTVAQRSTRSAVGGNIKTHHLKTWPEFFSVLSTGEKTLEVRKNDRGFKVGHILHLREFIPCGECHGSGRIWDVGDRCACGCLEPHGSYTGKSLKFRVTHVLDGEGWGLIKGYVAMSLKKVDKD